MDYTSINKPVQTITGIKSPQFITFSDNGDMFVSSDNSIYVYDSNGRQKTTYGLYGSKSLQFIGATGIAINEDVLYVAEYYGRRIHKLTLEGEFIGTFSCCLTHKGQFALPWDMCIGRDHKIYVADRGYNCVQVFHNNGSISHNIEGNISNDGEFRSPGGLSFDPSGHLHVTCSSSNIVAVFTQDGQYIRQYGQSYLNGPRGISIDSAGNSLVVNYDTCSLVIFDPHGNYIHSIEGFNGPTGVAVASNGSVWVADQYNHRLVKFCQ